MDRPDREYGLTVRLSYHRCLDCGLVYADPVLPEQIPSFYGVYSTHGRPKQSFLGLLGNRRALAHARRVIAPDARVLDYGCGNGRFLLQLRDHGYTNLTGYDFDLKAAELARSAGLHIVDEIAGPYDAIVLNHVVEHLLEPAEVLRGLADRLVPGGTLLVRMPNCNSTLARLFKDRWRGWETPRHLRIFTLRASARLFDELPFDRVTITTSNAMWFGMVHESLKQWGRLRRHAAAFAGLPVSEAIRAFAPRGEELVVVATRQGS
jgi:SAM-dependent methyltransferase